MARSAAANSLSLTSKASPQEANTLTMRKLWKPILPRPLVRRAGWARESFWIVLAG